MEPGLGNLPHYTSKVDSKKANFTISNKSESVDTGTKNISGTKARRQRKNSWIFRFKSRRASRYAIKQGARFEHEYCAQELYIDIKAIERVLSKCKINCTRSTAESSGVRLNYDWAAICSSATKRNDSIKRHPPHGECQVSGSGVRVYYLRRKLRSCVKRG